MNGRSWAALGLVLAVAGCSPARETTEAPRATSPAPGAGANSRDDAKPQAAPDAPSSAALPPGHPPVGSAASGKPVAGTVSLAPELASRAQPTDVLYLIARDRSAKTVAVRREAGVRFPHAFELSAADAMVADQPFAGPFDITARLSKSGDAFPAPGDLEGTTAGVAEGARSVSVVIAKVRQ